MVWMEFNFHENYAGIFLYDKKYSEENGFWLPNFLVHKSSQIDWKADTEKFDSFRCNS